MNIETNGIKCHVKNGDMVLHYPHRSYLAYMDEPGCEFIYIHFDYSIGENLRILDGYDFSGIVPGDSIKTDTDLLEYAYRQYQLNEIMSALFLKSAFMMILCGFFNACIEKKDFKSFEAECNKNKRSASVTFLQPVLIYITENLHRPVSIVELAQISGLSEKYFIRYFKEAIGVSPGKYLNQLKMNRARTLIYRKEHTLKEISNLLGYSDQYAFSKAFKKHYRLPPSEFT